MSTPTAEQTIRAGANRIQRDDGPLLAAMALMQEAVRRVPESDMQDIVRYMFPEDSWPIPRLMGMKAAAAAFGVRDSNLHKVKGLVPALTLDRGNLYRATDVERIAQARQRNGGE